MTVSSQRRDDCFWVRAGETTPSRIHTHPRPLSSLTAGVEQEPCSQQFSGRHRLVLFPAGVVLLWSAVVVPAGITGAASKEVAIVVVGAAIVVAALGADAAFW
jgi:hypothetical protein